MACYEKDCHYVMTHDGDCFYEGFPMDKKENCPMYKAKTNADRIRSMSDEELAEWLSNALNENSVSEGLCPQTIEFSRNCYKNNTDCNDKICIMAWLKQDAKNA